jgi:hypothetical protein
MAFALTVDLTGVSEFSNVPTYLLGVPLAHHALLEIQRGTRPDLAPPTTFAAAPAKNSMQVCRGVIPPPPVAVDQLRDLPLTRTMWGRLSRSTSGSELLRLAMCRHRNRPFDGCVPCA